eukprot:CAMPEP_0115876008 /NCGR_PEP_ID=MMETSP0287-20121206/25419_1 /TAXON_ID=412157 /ORGANISM="Chrysochromulina rotalis, Strain UIO044" /LENGTH=220 /DNA_ID=CAMNT_0003331345 /DNA_START=220 /DNA_END=884 /DNA_ORIENTATION=-
MASEVLALRSFDLPFAHNTHGSHCHVLSMQSIRYGGGRGASQMHEISRLCSMDPSAQARFAADQVFRLRTIEENAVALLAIAPLAELRAGGAEEDELPRYSISVTSARDDDFHAASAALAGRQSAADLVQSVLFVGACPVAIACVGGGAELALTCWPHALGKEVIGSVGLVEVHSDASGFPHDLLALCGAGSPEAINPIVMCAACTPAAWAAYCLADCDV